MERKSEIKTYIFIDGKVKKGGKPLELVKNNSFQWVYNDKGAVLTIEKEGHNIISATLKNVSKKHDTINEWDNMDYGRAVFNKKKGDYILEWGLPKIFRVFKNDHKEGEPWCFGFNYHYHLILKDRDEKKPYYWYYFDYSPSIADFIYKTLSPYINKDKGQIVAIPGELGGATVPWGDNDYFVNFFYCGFDEEKVNYDFYKETTENWWNENSPPSLIITFLPTYFKNYELQRGEKTTGTTWTKQIWQVFGKEGVPIVIKCYRGFIFTNLFREYREFYNQISSIVELPTEIDGRETGSSNLLVFFNCPWLSKKNKYSE